MTAEARFGPSLDLARSPAHFPFWCFERTIRATSNHGRPPVFLTSRFPFMKIVLLCVSLFVSGCVADTAKPSEAPNRTSDSTPTDSSDSVKAPSGESATRVSPSEFQKHYALVGTPETMRSTKFLGQENGKVFIRVHSMSPVTRDWSERVIYVELDELDPAFRESLPQQP